MPSTARSQFQFSSPAAGWTPTEKLIRRFSDCLGCEMVNEMAKRTKQGLAPPVFSTDPGCETISSPEHSVPVLALI